MKYLDTDIIIANAAEIEKEPMLFGCDAATASELGGPLTWKMLDAIPKEEHSMLVIDCRTHMLKPGWLPAIGGWHLDNSPRVDDGQPLPEETIAYHYGVTLDAKDQPTGSMTEFIRRSALPKLPPMLTDGWRARGFKTLWGLHDHLIRAHVAASDNHEFSYEAVSRVNSGHPYAFGAEDYHRAIPATKSGWRWFFRASVGSGRPVENKIRRQTQVYLDPALGGW